MTALRGCRFRNRAPYLAWARTEHPNRKDTLVYDAIIAFSGHVPLIHAAAGS
jgi:hypothetical protein